MSALRARIGPDFPLGLSSFPYVDFHPAFPYSVFLGPGGAQYNLPQVYWKTIGDRVDESFVHTYVFNRAYGRAILPTGQTYLNPKAGQVRRFRQLAALARDGRGQLVVVAALARAPVEGRRAARSPRSPATRPTTATRS